MIFTGENCIIDFMPIKITFTLDTRDILINKKVYINNPCQIRIIHDSASSDFSVKGSLMGTYSYFIDFSFDFVNISFF